MTVSHTKQQVIKSIRELNNRVTVADVVATTGLSLNEVTEELNSVAAESQATLEVTNVGQVFYCFPPNFAYRYFAQGFKKVLLRVWKKTFQVFFFIFRISFGMILLLSLWIIFGSILLFQTLLSAAFGASDEVIRMWRDFLGLVNRVAIWDIISWRKHGTELQEIDQAEGRSRQGFLLDCYSFLFGEGNPNEHLEDDRWKLLAQVIRLNEGIIIAEHLPPYTGRPADDEQALFKVLSKFSGYPKLSESGQLIYIFPSMQQRSTNSSYAFMPEFIEERPWHFSQLSKATLRPVIALALGNFLGGLLFFCLFTFGTGFSSQPPPQFLFLAIYGSLFLLVPMIRFLVIQVLNYRISKRNIMVKQFENAIGNPNQDIRLQLEDAEKLRKETIDHTADNQIVYTTKKDYLEQLTDNL